MCLYLDCNNGKTNATQTFSSAKKKKMKTESELIFLIIRRSIISQLQFFLNFKFLTINIKFNSMWLNPAKILFESMGVELIVHQLKYCYISNFLIKVWEFI